MKKVNFSLVCALFFLAVISNVKAQSPVSAFTGNWMLDKEKTNMSKDFPEKLKNYKMAVSGSEEALNVRSQVEGDVRPETGGAGSRTTAIDSVSVTGSTTMRDRSSSSLSGGINYGGTMAIYFTANNVTYNLNGKEVKNETTQGSIRVKAKPDKSGKALQFTTFRPLQTPSGVMEVIIREEWKISEDGKSLKLYRTVQTPDRRDEITMMLKKVG